ncbi:con-Ins Im2-like [Ruditapes philippinarum]|uniref:con-Ins Im2-like n=1 Tax=Ruditapes philippinarum TaxID=129788 RepID=UPI00295B0A01|nr:con-Ins Im2-like [Ruditapes philippinarum]XP_060590898.1 con-Ins Im2-like [Ruditapes philippinarum]
MQYILASLILIFTLREAKCGYEHWCTSSMAAQGSCGHGLDDLLSLACGATGYNAHGSYSRKRKRRSPTEIKMELNGITIGGHKAKDYLTKRTSFYFQGIVCECCINQCEFDEILGYCNF